MLKNKVENRKRELRKKILTTDFAIVGGDRIAILWEATIMVLRHFLPEKETKIPACTIHTMSI